jgi:hypothetical protein
MMAEKYDDVENEFGSPTLLPEEKRTANANLSYLLYTMGMAFQVIQIDAVITTVCAPVINI